MLECTIKFITNSQKSVIGFSFYAFRAGAFPWIDILTVYGGRFICLFVCWIFVFALQNVINFARFSKLELINVKLWSKITLLASKMAGWLAGGQNRF